MNQAFSGVELMKSISFAIVLLAASTSLFAQAAFGSILGTVKDPSGAVIQGASVTSTSIADGGRRTVTTNDQGYFLIPTLLPGDYKVVIEARGFRNHEVERVSVAVGQNVRVDATMTISGDTVSVEVAGGDGAAVDTQQALVGGVVSTRQIAATALNRPTSLEL